MWIHPKCFRNPQNPSTRQSTDEMESKQLRKRHARCIVFKVPPLELYVAVSESGPRELNAASASALLWYAKVINCEEVSGVVWSEASTSYLKQTDTSLGVMTVSVLFMCYYWCVSSVCGLQMAWMEPVWASTSKLIRHKKSVFPHWQSAAPVNISSYSI